MRRTEWILLDRIVPAVVPAKILEYKFIFRYVSQDLFEKKNEPSSEVREGSGSRSESILRKSF